MSPVLNLVRYLVYLATIAVLYLKWNGVPAALKWSVVGVFVGCLWANSAVRNAVQFAIKDALPGYQGGKLDLLDQSTVQLAIERDRGVKFCTRVSIVAFITLVAVNIAMAVA